MKFYCECNRIVLCAHIQSTKLGSTVYAIHIDLTLKTINSRLVTSCHCTLRKCFVSVQYTGNS